MFAPLQASKFRAYPAKRAETSAGVALGGWHMPMKRGRLNASPTYVELGTRAGALASYTGGVWSLRADAAPLGDRNMSRTSGKFFGRSVKSLAVALLAALPTACAPANAAPVVTPDEPFVLSPDDGPLYAEQAPHDPTLLAAPAPAGPAPTRPAPTRPAPGDTAEVLDAELSYDAPAAAINEHGQPEVYEAPTDDAPAPVLGNSEVELEDRDPSALTDFDPYLRDYGTWVDHPHYGTVWVPERRVVGSRFSPYVTRGHWSLTTAGDWIWVSDYPFGWVVFHYGRWVWTPDYGWGWIAGRRYSHAWVEFRTFTSPYAYIGWGPLPPRYIWRGGMAVAIGRYYPVPYVFCPYDYAFYPSVASYVIWERHRVRRLIHRSRPYRHRNRVAAVAVSPPVSHIPPRARPAARVLPNPKAIAMARGTARKLPESTLSGPQRRVPAGAQAAPLRRSSATPEAPVRRALPPTLERRTRTLTPGAPRVAPRIDRARRPMRPALAPTRERLPPRVDARATERRVPSAAAPAKRVAPRAKPPTRMAPPKPSPRAVPRTAVPRKPSPRSIPRTAAPPKPSPRSIPRTAAPPKPSPRTQAPPRRSEPSRSESRRSESRRSESRRAVPSRAVPRSAPVRQRIQPFRNSPSRPPSAPARRRR